MKNLKIKKFARKIEKKNLRHGTTFPESHPIVAESRSSLQLQFYYFSVFRVNVSLLLAPLLKVEK